MQHLNLDTLRLSVDMGRFIHPKITSASANVAVTPPENLDMTLFPSRVVTVLFVEMEQ
jgi:hypothetical protein